MPAFIRTTGVSLDVPIFLQRDRDAKGWGGIFLGAAFDPPRRTLSRLLDNISFEVGEGDRLAILGRNGAGKSTLLRVLNGVYQPTSGTLQVGGSCQALLNMSLGFSPDATVRENVFLRGVAMGLTASFLRGEIKSILDFSGLNHKASHRLKTLSTGQKMRLGFAISTAVQHDIMLMDEWVGTGDADFMAKAKQRMQSRVGGSKIVVLASHSIGLLRDMCNKALVLERGRLAYAGDVTSSLKVYHELMARLRTDGEIDGGEGLQAGAQVYGAIEEIAATGTESMFLVSGWMADTEGRIPSVLALERNGFRYVAEQFDRIPRPDVMRHFGLGTDMCGFRALVRVPGVGHPAGLGAGLRVLGGNSTDLAHAPLRMSAAVASAISAESGLPASPYQ